MKGQKIPVKQKCRQSNENKRTSSQSELDCQLSHTNHECDDNNDKRICASENYLLKTYDDNVSVSILKQNDDNDVKCDCQATVSNGASLKKNYLECDRTSGLLETITSSTYLITSMTNASSKTTHTRLSNTKRNDKSAAFNDIQVHKCETSDCCDDSSRVKYKQESKCASRRSNATKSATGQSAHPMKQLHDKIYVSNPKPQKSEESQSKDAKDSTRTSRNVKEEAATKDYNHIERHRRERLHASCDTYISNRRDNEDTKNLIKIKNNTIQDEFMLVHEKKIKKEEEQSKCLERSRIFPSNRDERNLLCNSELRYNNSFQATIEGEQVDFYNSDNKKAPCNNVFSHTMKNEGGDDVDLDYDNDMDTCRPPWHDSDVSSLETQVMTRNKERQINPMTRNKRKQFPCVRRQQIALNEYHKKHKPLHERNSYNDAVADSSSESTDAAYEITTGQVITTINIAATEDIDHELQSIDSSSILEDVPDFSVTGLLNTIVFDERIIEISPPSPPFNPDFNLYTFQKQALGFMYDIETKEKNFPTLSSIQVASPDAPQSNNVLISETRMVQQNPFQELNIRAGWLASEAGTGKTVVAISLICSNSLSMPAELRSLTWKKIFDRFNEFLGKPTRYGTNQPWATSKERITLKATVIITSNKLLGQWEDEFTKYAPHLKVRRYHPPSKDAHTLDLGALISEGDEECAKNLSRADAIVTTATMKWPDSIVKNFCFHRVIMDEAHLLGKSGAACFKNAKAFKANHRWCVTSAPMSSSLVELEKQAEFLGFMKVQSFAQSYRACKDAFQAKSLSEYLGWDSKLRNEQFRSFADVLKQVMLRQKAIPLTRFSSMSITLVKMNRDEKSHYQTQFQDPVMQQQLKQFSTQALGCSVAKLQKLLRKCVYPDKNHIRREKVTRLLKCLAQDLDEHRQTMSFLRSSDEDDNINQATLKVVVFTVSDAIHSDCYTNIRALNKNIQLFHLDGRSNGGANRNDEVIRRFQLNSTRPAVLVCTWNKQVGRNALGISLTSASKVYFMEPWIDPFMEEEATRRIRRIGQAKNVPIVKFVYYQTFEQNIILFHRMMHSRHASSVASDIERGMIYNGVLSVEAAQVITRGMLLDDANEQIVRNGSE